LIQIYLDEMRPDCSAAERSIIRRVAVLSVELEQLEQKFAINGEASPNQLDLYGRSVGNLRRCLELLIGRRARDITPLNPSARPSHAPIRDKIKMIDEVPA
jgi:hypothetical protein